MKFNGNDGGVAITALTLDMSDGGAATLNNGLTLTDGNLVLASGHGIDFSANSNASGMSSELLNDYEEGTWTPTAGSDAGVFTAGYSAQAGHYTKIGNRVVATFDINLSSRTLSGAIAFLYGLPFAVRNNGDLSGSFGNIVLVTNKGTNFYQVSIYAQNNSSFCYITGTTSNTSNLSTLPDEFWSTSTRVAGGVIYNTA